MRDEQGELDNQAKLRDFVGRCFPRTREERTSTLITLVICTLSGLVGGQIFALVCLGFLLGLLAAPVVRLAATDNETEKN